MFALLFRLSRITRFTAERMKTKRPFEFLGIYLLPAGAGVHRSSALVVLHLEIAHRSKSRRIGHSIATALLLFGKREAIHGRTALPDLLYATGVSQPGKE